METLYSGLFVKSNTNRVLDGVSEILKPEAVFNAFSAIEKTGAVNDAMNKNIAIYLLTLCITCCFREKNVVYYT